MSEDAKIETEFEFKMPLPEDMSALMAVKFEDAVNPILSKIVAEAKRNIIDDGTVRTKLLHAAVAKKIQSKRVRRGRGRSPITGHKFFAAVGINRKIQGIDENGHRIRPVFYAHLVNNGTGERKTATGQNAGVVEPTFFLDHAVNSCGGARALNAALKKAATEALQESAQ